MESAIRSKHRLGKVLIVAKNEVTINTQTSVDSKKKGNAAAVSTKPGIDYVQKVILYTA
jgi:hypothetical protein